MNYETFKRSLLEALRAQAGEEVSFYTEAVPKNNGIVREGLILKKRGSSVVPAVSLEELYERMDGQPVDYEELAERLLAICHEETSWIEDQLEDFHDFGRASGHIFARVINAGLNEKQLEQIPHEKILDLAIVCYYVLEKQDGASTVLIDNRILEYWDITSEQLLAIGKANTARKIPASLFHIDDLIRLLEEERYMQYAPALNEDEKLPLYVMTNTEKYYGAYALFYPGLQRHVADVLNTSFYILPSSIHETILVPDSGQYTPQELQEIVKSANRTVVEQKEFLSDSVYYYDRDTCTVSIVAKG